MAPAPFQTADVSDQLGPAAAACTLQLRQFGGARAFRGCIRTVRCRDDNGLVRAACGSASPGEVLVVDGAGSLRCALLGDNLAALAARHGWAGLIIHGVVRDSRALAALDLGIKAIGTSPCRSTRHGAGARDEPVTFGGATFIPGQWVWSDDDGVLVAPAPPGAAP